MLIVRPLQRGMSIIELMVVITVLAILLATAAPNFANWLQSSQIRTSTESIIGGLQLARAEAVRRNAPMIFQFTDTVDNSCTITKTGGSWVVSQVDVTSKCATAASDTADITTDPRIKQKRSAKEGSPNALVTSDQGSITFTPLGQVTPATAVNIDITNPTGGACATTTDKTKPMRCLRVLVSASGQIRMCDPARTSTSANPDPQAC